MARFIVVHQLGEGAANADFQELRETRKHLFKLAENPNVQWLHSWFVFESARQICEYESADKATILRALHESGIDAIYPVVTIDEVMLSGPNDFPGEFSE